MFECKGCIGMRETIDLLKSEVSHLRETNKKFSDQIVAATDLRAYNALTFGPNHNDHAHSYYGHDSDDIQTRDEFGNLCVVQRSALRTE